MRTPQIAILLLVDLAFILHALVSELHWELIDRHGLDRRWRLDRQAFLRKNGVLTKDGIWPI